MNDTPDVTLLSQAIKIETTKDAKSFSERDSLKTTFKHVRAIDSWIVGRYFFPPLPTMHDRKRLVVFFKLKSFFFLGNLERARSKERKQ